MLHLPRAERLAHLQRRGDLAMERLGAGIPVTPVPLAAAAPLSFGSSVVPHARLLERMDEMRDRLTDLNAKVVREELPVQEVWERAWRMRRMRRLVVQESVDLVILPTQRPLLEYCANSIRHPLPTATVVALTPVAEADTTLSRLATRAEVGTTPRPRR